MAMTGETEPPYLRIAAEIRRRVADGELAPGDRVPPTRQLAKEWGVALATATRALTLLRQEGVVRARPRVGTVVSPRGRKPAPAPAPASTPVPAPAPGAGAGRRSGPVPGRGPLPDRQPAQVRRRAADPDQELTRERIVRAAIELADAEGLDALSMRAVAARLGVATMSPYRHVNGKDELVTLMADAAFGESSHPAEAPEGWRARLELSARTLWALYRRHPWLAQMSTLTRPLTLPNLLEHSERMLAALEGSGLAPKRRFDLVVLLYAYVHGIAVNLEREAHAAAATGLTDEQWMERQEPLIDALAASGRYPAFTGIMAAFDAAGGYDLDLDGLFELGLAGLLDGFAVLVERARMTRRSRGSTRR
jgi:AcrR family transcriptional regulator